MYVVRDLLASMSQNTRQARTIIVETTKDYLVQTLFCRPAQGQKGTDNPLSVVTHYRGRAHDVALRANLVLDIAADKEHVHAVVVPPMAAPGSSRPATCQPRI